MRHALLIVAAVLGGLILSARASCLVGAGLQSNHEEAFSSALELMSRYDGRPGVSLMRFGKAAMIMGRTVGNAGSAWTRKVAKAFRKVSAVYMLEYSEAPASLQEEIESAVSRGLDKDNLILRNGKGELVFDETYGSLSEDGKRVSDLVILMYGQSVVCLKGSVLASDVERIVRRLGKQL